jgi:L-ribulokinase
MDLLRNAASIKNGKTSLGIELGSTRIKAVLVTQDCQTIAASSYAWENKLEHGVWTYSLEEVWMGIQVCYSQIAADVQSLYHVPLQKIGSIGISAMMHGYLVFNKENQLLTPFRTWRNNITGEASDYLTDKFQFNIPQRWSIAHLYQAILNGEEHVRDIDFMTTLAGYVHWKLCGEKILGIGDASGMFPINEQCGSYDKEKLEIFSQFDKVKEFPWRIEAILPAVLKAGENAGTLSAKGAKLLDTTTGMLEAGSLMAPPEGDAGTGMVGTNSVRKCTGNISVGTSAFSMNVLDRPLKAVHRDIDIVTTPEGALVAMVHINNCSSDINAWVHLFGEFATCTGLQLTLDKLYELLFTQAVKADKDAGGLVNYSYLSGENITRIDAGRPMFLRTPHSRFNLANFMLAQLYAAFAPLKIGMDILMREEGIKTDVMIAQGGLFQTPGINQQILADTLNIPITIMDTAGEGGPWGMAVLAVFAKWRKEGEVLADFLDERVFCRSKISTLTPDPAGVVGCQQFVKNYKDGLPVEAAAGKFITDNG